MTGLNLCFDSVPIDEDAIIGMHVKTPVFDKTFKVGLTICRSATLRVLKSAVASMPSAVSFDLPGDLPVLYVDSVDDTDDTYYEFSLVDSMVQLNRVIDFSLCTTLGDVLDLLQSDYGFTHIFNGVSNAYISYIRAFAFSWDGYTTAREVVSMIAEAFGGYAIFSDKEINFNRFDTTPIHTILIGSVGDIVVGEQHTITRVVYDNGVAFYEYGTDTGDTVYISPNNVFFGDANTQTRLDDVGDQIIGLTFESIKVNNAPIPDFTCAGDYIAIGTHKFFVQEDWDYNGSWLGGYEFEIQTQQQEETDVIYSELEKEVLSINTTVNHQEGLLDILGTRTDGIEADLIHFQVDAAASEVRVTNQDSTSPTSYTSFKGDGMRIYVEGEQVAEATATRFECDKGLGVQDWAIEQGSSANTLLFYRKG